MFVSSVSSFMAGKLETRSTSSNLFQCCSFLVEPHHFGNMSRSLQQSVFCFAVHRDVGFGVLIGVVFKGWYEKLRNFNGEPS